MKVDTDMQNFYEYLVIEELKALDLDEESDYISDLCCIVLNQLPPRYIRHHVDMAFYLPKHERVEMEMKVKEAITRAQKYLNHLDYKQ